MQSTNRQLGHKYSILAKVGFGAKRGWLLIRQYEFALHKTAICTNFWAVCSKMLCNMLQNALHFGAKRRLFWCKTQAVLVLNARRFGAKCKVKCCKTQGGTHKNTHRGGRQNPFEPLTKWLKRGKTYIKKWGFSG